jgi:hypothetical protein
MPAPATTTAVKYGMNADEVLHGLKELRRGLVAA